MQAKFVHLKFSLYVLTVEKKVAFSLLPPKKSLEKGVLKKNQNQNNQNGIVLEFCSETHFFFFLFFLHFVNGKLKDHSILKASTANHTNPEPVLLATTSVILAAKCGASLEHEEIQPGRQLQSCILVLEKAFQSLASVLLFLPSTPQEWPHMCWLLQQRNKRKAGNMP